MQIHELKQKTENKDKKRVGRGGKRGTYSGKGIKGQKSRAGRRMRPEMRDIVKKLPKLRGYKFNSIVKDQVTVGLGIIDTKFKNGDTVNPKILSDMGLIKKGGRAFPVVKVLSNGEITKKLNFSGCLISAGAKEKIEKAGGKIS